MILSHLLMKHRQRKEKKRINKNLECLRTSALESGLITRYSENKKIGFCCGNFQNGDTLASKCVDCIYFRDNINIHEPSIILSENYIPSIDSKVNASESYENQVQTGITRVSSNYIEK